MFGLYETAFATMGWQNILMLAIGGFLIYLGIGRKMEGMQRKIGGLIKGVITTVTKEEIGLFKTARPPTKKVTNRFKVTVGSIAHPMVDNHFIEWIEVLTDTRTHIAYLKPGDAPEATFVVEGKVINVREHCNLHGLWKNPQ